MSGEFDSIATQYSGQIDQALGHWGWAGHQAFYLAKEQLILRLLRAERDRLRDWLVLDYGCGFGRMQGILAPHFGRVYGADPSREMLTRGSGLRVHFDGTHLPFRSETFEFCYAICVFHHIPSADRPRVLQEILRVLKPSGRFLIIEHNLANPFVGHFLRKCAMDRDAEFLRPPEADRLMETAGLKNLDRHFLIFSPAPSWPIFRWMESALFRFPFGAQYAVMGTKPA